MSCLVLPCLDVSLPVCVCVRLLESSLVQVCYYKEISWPSKIIFLALLVLFDFASSLVVDSAAVSPTTTIQPSASIDYVL